MCNLPSHASSIVGNEKCVFYSQHIPTHLVTLPEHMHPYEIFGLFRKSHALQNVASCKFLEDDLLFPMMFR